MTPVTQLTVMLGYRCNLRCRHCIVSGKSSFQLSAEEIQRIIGAVKTYRVPSLLFVGGEPTLYIKDIKYILSQIENVESVRISITTNGYFATTVTRAQNILGRISRLHQVNVSYDHFHRKFVPVGNIRNLYAACQSRGIEFAVLSAIRSPMDLRILTPLSKMGKFPVVVQQLQTAGSARKNGLSYAYPSFDSRVLDSKCDSVQKIAYLCGQGFTLCCSALSMTSSSSKLCHKSIAEHLNSKFYRLMAKYTFGELCRKLGVSIHSLKPEHSHKCALCVHILYPRLESI